MKFEVGPRLYKTFHRKEGTVDPFIQRIPIVCQINEYPPMRFNGTGRQLDLSMWDCGMVKVSQELLAILVQSWVRGMEHQLCKVGLDARHASDNVNF